MMPDGFYDFTKGEETEEMPLFIVDNLGMDRGLLGLIDVYAKREGIRRGDVIEYILMDWFSKGFELPSDFYDDNYFLPTYKKYNSENNELIR